MSQSESAHVLGSFYPASFAIASFHEANELDSATKDYEKLVPALGQLTEMQEFLSMTEVERAQLLARISEQFEKLPDDVVDEVVRGGQAISGSLQHETMHYWQSVSSPYGYFLGAAHRARAQLTYACTLFIRTDMGIARPKIPYLRWQAETTDERIRHGLLTYTQPWSDLLLIESALNDNSCLSFDNLHAAWECVRPILSMSLGADSREHELPALNRIDPAQPLYPTAQGGRLGARAVYEGMARLYEFRAIAVFDRGSSLREYIAQRSHDEYGLCIELAARVLKDRVLSPTCLGAVLDLALLGPIGIPYHLLAKHCIYWEDIHPGWRFMRSLHALNESSPFDDSYEAITGAICDATDWPRPSVVATLGTKLEDTGSPFVELLRRASILRQGTPDLFANPEYGPHLFSKLPPPFILKPFGVQANEQRSIVSPLLRTHYFSEVSAQLMCSGTLLPIYSFLPGKDPFRGDDPVETLFGVPRGDFEELT